MKHNLTDCTFIIPVSYDHPDRLENLTLIKDYINHYFDTNIIVGEINTRQMGADVHFNYPTFHRTKALNEMTLMTTTPYVINWDADVLVDPIQILIMVNQLIIGRDVVYPYDGRFYMVDRSYIHSIRENMSLATVENIKFRSQGATSMDGPSYGGAVGYNKSAFINAGGENEMNVSYSNEDYERWFRFNELGLKVERVNGPLYHINHWRGSNSSFNHSHGVHNMMLWDIERNFKKEQLLKMINHTRWNNGMTLQDLAGIR